MGAHLVEVPLAPSSSPSPPSSRFLPALLSQPCPVQYNEETHVPLDLKQEEETRAPLDIVEYKEAARASFDLRYKEETRSSFDLVKMGTTIKYE